MGLNDGFKHFECPKCGGDIIRCRTVCEVRNPLNDTTFKTEYEWLTCSNCNSEYTLMFNRKYVTYKIEEVK